MENGYADIGGRGRHIKRWNMAPVTIIILNISPEENLSTNLHAISNVGRKISTKTAKLGEVAMTKSANGEDEPGLTGTGIIIDSAPDANRDAQLKFRSNQFLFNL